MRAAPNAARNAEIVRLRGSGLWPNEIAKKLGVTRNVVIGALNRAGQCSGDVDRAGVMATVVCRSPGEPRGNAKLTPSDVVAMRSQYDPMVVRGDGTVSALARRYAVSYKTASYAIRRLTWAHVA